MIRACVEHVVATAPGDSSGLIALTVGLGSLALAIYGAGVVALCRSVRSSRWSRPRAN